MNSSGGVPIFLSSHGFDTLEADERDVTESLPEGLEGPSSESADFRAEVQDGAGAHPDPDVGAEGAAGRIEEGEVERGRPVDEGGG